jgi:GT2 family glycosyltransferase
MDLSILVVSYNCAEDVERCFASLTTGAEGLDWEFLLWDNASHDVAQLKVLAQDPRIRLISSSENVGFGRANNALAKNSHGKWLLCLNPDTIVPRGTIGALINHLEAHPEVGVSAPTLRNADGSHQHSWNVPMGILWEFAEVHYLQNVWRNHFKESAQKNHPKGPWDVGFSSGACLCLSRQLFLDCGGFDVDFFLNHEDIELCHRIRAMGRAIHVLPQQHIIHLDGGTQRKNWSRFVKDRLDAKRVWFRKRYHGPARLFARMLWLEGVILRIVVSFLLHRGNDRTRLSGYLAALKAGLGRG